MLSLAQKKITPENITDVLNFNYQNVMQEFYEMQSGFLSTRYKIHNSLETSSIILCFIIEAHLTIMRLREVDLDCGVSLDSFLQNLQQIEIPTQKIVSIVNTTGIPKETVRRKIRKLIQKEYIFKKNKGYYWKLTPKRQTTFIKIMESDIKRIAKFVFSFTKHFDLNLTKTKIEEEISREFSFYFYHFLNCQISWLKMWQTKIKDIDLIFIAMQALIPTLKCENSLNKKSDFNLENLHNYIGKTSNNFNLKTKENSINASSISEISGIPRATCIRKLDKLVKLGMLVREIKTKRYYVNQFTNDRTKHITKKENVDATIKIFTIFLTIVINAITRKS